MRKRRGLAIVAVLLVIGIAIAFAAHFNQDNGLRQPQQPLKQAGAGDHVDPDDAAQQRQYVLELDRALSREEQLKLESIAEFGGRLGEGRVLVRAGEDSQKRLEALPFINSVSAYQAQDKMSGVSDDGAEIELVAALFSEEDRPGAAALVRSLNGEILKDEGRYLKIRLNKNNMAALAASPGVMYLENDEQPEFLNDRARDITGARPLAMPGFMTRTGLTGAGQTIGLADSGLDTGSLGSLHPDLQNEPGQKPRVIMLKSWAGVGVPADTVGHGTHMAGTLVGSGQASQGRYAGVAPKASLYFQGIVDEDDKPALPLDLENLFRPAYEGGVRIHVNGWGRKKNTYSSSTNQIDDFIFRHADFLAVFGAGNSGPQEGSLTSEANSKNALTVGATESPRPAFDNFLVDTRSTGSFSSRGPAGDGRIKPELAAPGTNIISTASRLVGGNLAGRPMYSSMRGTSMATAFTGGAAALLRQYLQEDRDIPEPSAALLKAVLINGARALDTAPGAAGYGLLDMGGTVTALENNLFDLVDHREGLATGASLTYEKEITRSGAPFKATLAWTDPPALPGAANVLVNNLDLEVIAPGGKKYYGNDFENKGVPDKRNNVEQVYIADPQPGLYKIIVSARGVQEGSAPGRDAGQDFALAYGQPPAQGIVVDGGEKREIKLDNGDLITAPGRMPVLVNDMLLSRENVLPAGAQVYLAGGPGAAQQAYAVVRSSRVNGVKTLELDGTTVLVRMQQENREGGYLVDPRAKNALMLNGDPVGSTQAIPPGASVGWYVNPLTQTIWKAEITSQEVSGIISGVDLEKQHIELLQGDHQYVLAPGASLSFNDLIVGADAAAAPFGGAAAAAGLENLLPGMPVQVTLGLDGLVYYLTVKRHLAVGSIETIDQDAQTGHVKTVSLSAGGTYQVMPGMQVLKDGAPAQPQDLGPGDLVILNLVPDSTSILGLNAYSQVSYGRVIYTESDMINLMDTKEGFILLRHHPGMKIFRWGLPAGDSVLSPGQWVRVIKDPATGEVLRVDIAESAGKVEETLEAYFPGENKIKTREGNEYRLSAMTKISKNDLPARAVDLMPGELVSLNLLYSSAGEGQVAASLDAKTRPGVRPPELKIKSTIPFADFSMITGSTTASRLLVFYAGGGGEQAELTAAGDFYCPVLPGQAGDIQLVAVDSKTGGIAGLWLSLPRQQQSFSDIGKHWAETDIRQLVERGMLTGYPDGTFRPDKPVTRVEFTAMITRLMGAGSAGPGGAASYQDAGKIPEWAQSSVALASSRGLVKGYEDNTFRPAAIITREEAASLLVRAYGILQASDLPATENDGDAYADQKAIAPWARQDIAQARELGLLGGRSDNYFAPKENLTRAETAAAVNRLLAVLTTGE